MGKWFDYRQNNSGGGFYFDLDAGVSVNVLIEADSAREADSKAESIGIYFDGCDTGMDCDCCGDRWYRTYGDGDDVPTVYGEEVTPNAWFDDSARFSIKWMGRDPEGFLHYADGRVLPFGL